MNVHLYPLMSVLSCMVAAACFGQPAQSLATGRKPNIVFIFADDWGWGDLGCHGSKLYKTPNLDRLAAEGTDFHQFYVNSAICSPSRVAVMTGHFPARYNMTQTFATTSRSNGGRNMPDWVGPDAAILPRMLKQAGYATGHFGKWHLASEGAADAPRPEAYGYDEVWLHAHRGSFVETPDGKDVYDTDKAIEFIRAHKDQPFFANIWIHEPHHDQFPLWEYLEQFKGAKDIPTRVFGAVLAHADARIGEVLKALDELGLTENTLVIFSSDNGPSSGGSKPKDQPNYTFTQGETDEYIFRGPYYSRGSSGGRKGYKACLFEGGIRVPFIVRWPSHTPAGRVDENSVLAAVDLLPTFCTIAGIQIPTDHQLDGENVLPSLSGQKWERSKTICWKIDGSTSGHTWPRSAIRRGQWKLITNDEDRVELYNIVADGNEQNNQAAQQPEILESLQAELRAWRATLPTAPDPSCISSARSEGKKK